jgi:hypothetical protein
MHSFPSDSLKNEMICFVESLVDHLTYPTTVGFDYLSEQKIVLS